MRECGTVSQFSQLFHGPAPRSPLYRLAVRLRHSRSNTSTEYSLAPGGYSIVAWITVCEPLNAGLPPKKHVYATSHTESGLNDLSEGT